MTLIDDDNLPLPMYQSVQPEANVEYSISERFRALWNDADPIGQLAISDMAQRAIERPAPIQDFNPFDGTHELREGYYENYIDAQNPYDIDFINRKIDRELANKEVAATAPLWQNLAVGVVDPLNALPFNVFRKAGIAAKSIGRTAGEVAVTGAGIAGTREAFLQATQETRTAEESAINIVASGLIAGALGGAGATIQGRAEFDMPRLQRETADYIRVTEGGSISAAKLDDAEIANIELNVRERLTKQGLVGEELERAVIADVAEERLALEGLADAFGLEKRLSFQDPVMRMLASPVRQVRETVSRLAEITSYQKKNIEGFRSNIPVENIVKKWDANVAQFSKRLNDLFLESKGIKPSTFNLIKTFAKEKIVSNLPEGSLTKEQFNIEVAKAARRNDKHENPFVAKAASELRKTVIEPLAKEAQRVGLLPEDLDVKTAESYLMRRYNHNEIVRNPQEFDSRSKQWLIEKRDAAIARVQEKEILLDKLKNMTKEDKLNLRRTESATKKLIPLAQKKVLLVEQEMNILQKQVQHYESMLKNINDRIEKFKSDELDANEKQYWKTLLNDLRRGKSKEKVVQGGETKTLLEFIASKGGIEDRGGDLKAMGADKWHTQKPFRSKLISDSQYKGQNNFLPVDTSFSTSNTADDITLAAWEAGYFQGFSERPEINDLFSAIDNELRGEPVYSMYRDVNLEVQQYNEYLSYLSDFLPKNARDMSIEDLKDFMAKMSADAEGIEPPKYIRSTPATRARYKELQYNQKRIIDRLEKANNAYNRNTAKYMKAASELIEKREIKGVKIEEINLMRTQLKELTKDVEKLANDLADDRYRASFLDEDFDQVAQELRERILGSPFGRLDYSYKTGENMRMSKRNPMIGVTGSLKARVWDIPDERIEDFLVNDVEALSASYVRKMGAQIALYDEFGSISLEPQVREINNAFEQLKNANADKSARLEAKRLQALEDLQALRDRLLGTYQMDDYSSSLARNVRIMKQLNYMRLLGGMTVSAIPDLGRPVMVHGVNRVFGNGLKSLINNKRAFVDAAKEIQDAGTALDVVLNTAAINRADLDEPLEIGSKFEQFVNKRSNEFSALTLMNSWNSATKQFVGVVAQSRIIKDIPKLLDGTLPKNDVAWLAANFIDKTNAKKILEQFEKHGEISGDVYIPNAREWDVEVRELFRSAIRKTVDSTIVTQGIDKPLWVDKGLLRLIAQFRGYGLASTQRVLLSGLQMRDMKTLNGIALMVGLGAMVYAIKEAQSGREISDDPVKWIIEGVDRSGITGWFMDANNITEKFTRGRIGVSALTNDPLMSRYASRGVIGALLGPSVGLVEDLATFTGGLGAGEINQSTIDAARRLIPYQNHFLFRELFDEADNNISAILGVKKINDISKNR